ncbi:rNA methylase PF01170 family [Clostridium sp. CAG:1013]|nr:rNA methylase PF01170 family [Clostridium sp. CAG:1013]
MENNMTFCIPCLFGVESLVAQELGDLGLEQVRAENGRVLFSGGWEAMIRANLNSRFGERVLLFLGSFQARSFEELFQGVKALPWERFLGKEDQFPVTGSCLTSQLHSVPDCQAIMKKAIVERLKSKYGLSWFPETGPLHRVRFRILKDQVSVMIDTSGEGLHKRGYRAVSNDAPLKETLAASLLKLSRLRSDGHLIDPFCGSGTLLVEGALMARNIAPGLNRSFTAETWKNIPQRLWQQEREHARSLERRDASFRAEGFDVDPAAVDLSLANAKKAGVEDVVSASVRDIRDFTQEDEYGCVVCNPPYGERLLDLRQAEELYKVMGQVFRPKRGWSFGIITPDGDFESIFGRKADKRRKLYNGMIQCQYYQYFKGEARPHGLAGKTPR